jgi:transcriptional regulator with XRE-family HTH domain
MHRCSVGCVLGCHPKQPALDEDDGTERRMSQEELSLRTGVHRNYIGGIERAERSPTVVTIGTIANALDVPVSELFRLAEERADVRADHR